MEYQNNIHDNYVDLADIPSDAFNIDDLDLDRPRSVADYSSWPAESSPAPLEAEDEGEEEMEETDYSEHEVEEDYDQDLEEDEIEEDSEDQEEEDQETGNEHDDYDAEDAELLEALLEDQAEVEVGDYMDQDHWDSEADLEEVLDHQQSPIPRANQQRGFADFLTEIQVHHDRDRQSEAPSESLFVDQGHDLLPPIESLLSSVRRSHARAVDLLHLQRGQALRPPAQDRSLLGPFGRGAAGPSRENQRLNHRHHPYGMPQDNSLRGRMERDNSRARDELVAVEMRPLRGGMRRNRTPPRSQPEVIDLTGEPDSPDEPGVIVAPRPRAPNALQNPGRNPRRRLSLNQRTPSLARSDSSLLGNNQNVIDLTLDDSPALPPLPQQLPRRNNHNHNHNHNHANPNPHLPRHHPHHYRRPPGMSRVPFISLDDQEGPGPSISARLADFVIHRLGFGRPPQDVEVQVIGGGLNMDNPIAGNIPILDYSNNATAARNGVPKRDHVPPPKAREGFTRDTGNEDDVVVCPSCEKELKYDPDAANDTAAAMSPARPAKKPRSKKDQEEHHFWALKDCGHVYCKDCYESRGVASKNSAANFRRDTQNPRKKVVLCAVEGCTTEANQKGNWVGLFI